jgi:hypothetical protein
MNEYSLLWDEEKKVYYLRNSLGETIGTLQDDTVFANQVLDAFNKKEAYILVLKELEKLKRKFDDFVKNINEYRTWRFL